MRIQSGSTSGLKSGLKDNDFVLEAISKQMIRLQDKLKRIDADQKLSPEEKTRQKKLISDQLNILRQQYTQRELAMKSEQKQVKPLSDGDSEQDDGSLFALINADGALSRAKSGRSVKTSLEGEQRTLKGEIKMDAARGVDVTKKEQRVSDLSSKIQSILEELAAEEDKAVGSFKQDEKDSEKEPGKDNERGGHVNVLI